MRVGRAKDRRTSSAAACCCPRILPVVDVLAEEGGDSTPPRLPPPWCVGESKLDETLLLMPSGTTSSLNMSRPDRARATTARRSASRLCS